MSSTFRFFWAAGMTKDGLDFENGSMVDPVLEVSLPGTYSQPKVIPFTCPINTTLTLWAYSAGDPDFTCALIQSEGCLDGELKCDKPTSASDKTALGTYVNYNAFHVDEEAPHVITSQSVRVSLSATAKSSSSIAGTAGYVYEIHIRNNDVDGSGDSISGVLYLWN